MADLANLPDWILRDAKLVKLFRPYIDEKRKPERSHSRDTAWRTTRLKLGQERAKPQEAVTEALL